MDATQFCKERSETITIYGHGRKSAWQVLGSGTAFAGTIGVVRIRDQYGDEGCIMQQYAGAAVGQTASLPTDYQPTA
jgi:hypothetical protein